MFPAVLEGFLLSIQPLNILGILFGYTIGIIVGSLPGITGVMAIALMLPLTYKLPGLLAIATLMGCYKGATYGGSIPAILINTPGTPEAAATALDGYPLAKKGEAIKALEMALFASIIGGTISNLSLMIVAKPLANIALSFGPAEISSLIFFSLTIITITLGNTSTDIVKGLISAGLGLFFAMIGLDIMTTTRRYCFGVLDLDRGLGLVPVLIGLLALSEVLIQSKNLINNSTLLKNNLNINNKIFRKEDINWKTRFTDIKVCFRDIVRSSFIGTFIGALPGIGATTAAFLSYGEAKRISKEGKYFGKGKLEGVAAAEAGNNAVCGSSLIPLVTLGIPGSITAAVLLGAFMIHGMMPGPMLMETHPSTLYGLFFLMIWTDPIGGLVIALPYIRIARFIIRKISKRILLPIIIILCFIGAYGMQFSIFDMKIVIFLGIFGYLMKKSGFNLPAFLIAFILGPILENQTRVALSITNNNPIVFLRSPIAVFLFSLSILSLIYSFKIKYNRREKTH